MKAYGEITLTVINDGSDGTSPYFISVGNESQNIPCGNDGLVSTNLLIEIPFVGYHGVQRIGCVATISSLPNGVTLGENTAATTENDGKIILNVAKGADFGGTDVLTGTIDLSFAIENTTLKKNFTWTKTKDGEVGKLYQLSPSSLVIKKGSDNSLSPATIIFSSTVTDGNSVQKLPYAGRFVIEESTNGGTYTSKYISPEDESNKEYTPSSTNVKVIKATLYAAGGIKNALDTQSVIVLTDIDNVDGALEEIRTEVTGVSSKVDSVEKSIKNEVWKDTIIKVVDKDGNVVEKTIENIIVDSSQDINGITNEVKKVTTKYDGDIASLEEKVAKSEQNIDGFKQTVSETYETKENATQNYSELSQTSTEIKGTVSNLQGQITSVKQTADGVDTEIKNAKGDSTSLKARIDGISADVSNASGEIGKVNVRAESIELGLSKKKDITPFNIRYIRDWQKGNSVDTTCRWTNIQVIVNNTNIESGEVNIIQPSSITLSSDVSITNITNFVDGNVSTYASYATNTEWHYIQIDLGADNTFDDGTITVWHRCDDTNSYRFNHKLEISSDGENWYSLFNSEVTDAYEESSYGKSYLINDGLITKNLSFLRLDINSITEKVQENANNYAQLKVESNALTGRVEGVENTTSDLQNTTIPNLDTKLTKNISEVKQQADSISNRVSKVEGTVEKQTQEIIDANGWRVEMANIGAYPEDPSVATKVVSMVLSNEGVTINRAASEGYRTQLTGDTVKIQYDNGRGVYDDAMKIEKDLMYLTRLMVKNGIDHGTLKEIPTNYTVNGNNVGCLVFISSSGNS